MPRDELSKSTLSLYRAAHEGSRTSVELLLVRIRPRLVSWVAGNLGSELRSHLEAEDIVQEILTKAYRHVGTFEPTNRRSFYKWIYTIARNTLTDAAKSIRAKKRRSPGQVPVHPGLAGPDPSASQVAMGREANERFVLALAGLSREFREIICLRRLEGKTEKEAAAELGITAKNASSRLSRAMRALREAMEEREG